jgi:hypothetical protein
MSYADEIIYIKSQCNGVELHANRSSDSHVYTKGVNKTFPMFKHISFYYTKLNTVDIHKHALRNCKFY